MIGGGARVIRVDVYRGLINAALFNSDTRFSSYK